LSSMVIRSRGGAVIVLEQSAEPLATLQFSRRQRQHPRSMMTRDAVRPHSTMPIVALRACCATHAGSGLALGAETITRRLPTWMK